MTRQQHIRRRPAVWLALFALWLQALLPLVHHPAGTALMDMSMDMSSMDMPAADAAATPASLGDLQNICLAPGTAPADPSDHAPDHKSPPPCPICQTFQMLHGGFIPPNPVALALPELYRLALAVPAGADEPEQPIHSGARARAPPVSA